MKLPLPPPPGRLAATAADITAYPDLTLWRVHFTSGEHVLAWDQLRHFGPTENRFDPHFPPPSVQERAVCYTGQTVAVALAEVYQRTRVVNRTFRNPYLTGWQPARPLHLLDLTGEWPVRNGTSHALNTGRRDHCRAWARAIHTRWPSLDGLLHSSAITGGAAVTLFTRAADSFPRAPVFRSPLSDPATSALVRDIAERINYRVR